MNNEQLNEQLNEILKEEDFLTFLCKVKEFEPDYKKSEFYKQTKMSLIELVKNVKIWKLLDSNTWINKIQKIIDSLNYDNLNKLFTEFADKFENDNQDLLDAVQNFKDIQDLAE